MEFKVQISQSALTEFDEIIAYSWANFPDSTERFADDLLALVDLVGSHPYIGAPLPERPGVRTLYRKPIVIQYRVEPDRRLIVILRFIHAARQR